MMRLLLPCVVSLLVVTSLEAADWTKFRGPNADGKVAIEGLPLKWSQAENVAWRTEIPGEGWSSPVVSGDRIFLTTAIENATKDGYTLALVCVNAKTGKIEKQTDIFTEGVNAPSIHRKNSHASPTPIIDGDRIYVHFGHQGTACLALDGTTIWKNEDLAWRPVHGNGGSPALVDGMLIFSRDGADINEIIALDARTGEVAWQTERGVNPQKRFSFCTPLVLELDGRTQVIFPGSDVVQSVHPTTGDEIWRVRYDGYSVVPRPIYESGLVFISTGFNTASLLAIDPTGEGDVTETHLKWRTDAAIPKTPSVVGFDGKVALVSDNGIATCFDAVSGQEIWKKRVGGNFSASPLLNGDHLYLLSEKGVCTVLDVTDGSIIEENDIGERALASFAVVGDDLLLRTDVALYRIGE